MTKMTSKFEQYPAESTRTMTSRLQKIGVAGDLPEGC